MDMRSVVAIAFLGVLILGFAGYANSANAIGGTISDQLSCQVVGGHWDAPNTCSVAWSPSTKINAGETLTIGPNIILKNRDTITNDGGIIRNFGTIENIGIINNINLGRIYNEPDSTIINSNTFTNRGVVFLSGLIDNNAVINNIVNIQINLDGHLRNNIGSTLSNSGILSISGLITNSGVIRNSNSINSAQIDINVIGQVINSNTLDNFDIINVNYDGTLSNTGTVNNFNTINQNCQGIISGTISSIQPINRCLPPVMCGLGTILQGNECIPVPLGDTDNDGIPNQFDLCPNDPYKIVPGYMGCGIADPEPISCGDGTTLNTATNQCEADSVPQVTCGSGTILDVLANQCIVDSTEQDTAPTVSISVTPLSGITPLTVDFTCDSSAGNAPLTYEWDFGDGESDSTQNPTHTYNNAETFTARCIVTDADGDTGSDSVSVSVEPDTTPTVTVSATPLSGLEPLTVDFTSSVTGGNGELHYSWDFGDGESLVGNTDPTHTYGTGVYQATLTVTDEDGDAGSASVEINVDVGIIPITIDIQPQTFQCGSKGVVPLVIFASPFFDPSKIDLDTITINGNAATEKHGKLHAEDINNDGLDDAVFHIDNFEDALDIPAADCASIGQTFVPFSASLSDGTQVEGQTDIILKGKKIKEN